jgi:hypothetical protein
MFAMLVGLMLVAALLACNNSSTPEVRTLPAPSASTPNMTDAKRLSDGAGKLIDAMKKPAGSFHFSFKGQENIGEDKTQPPQMGPVALQADISPEEINLTETRGSTTKTFKAKKGELVWGSTKLATVGVILSPSSVIAVGSSVTAPPSADLVGAIPADKFTFDTATATPSQKVGLDCKGTAWIAKDSGLLIKFNIDADYLDKYNRAWKEHYEGEVTPK